jgi:hypothetical protein
LPHAPNVEHILARVVRDAFDQQVRLRQLERHPAGDHRGPVVLQSPGQLGVGFIASQPGEIGIRGNIGRVSQGGEVPQCRERPGSVAVQGECRRQGVDHSTMRRTARLGFFRMLQKCGKIMGLIGPHRGAVVGPRFSYRIGLGDRGSGGQERGQHE